LSSKEKRKTGITWAEEQDEGEREGVAVNDERDSA
jgi:hypothetical protein